MTLEQMFGKKLQRPGKLAFSSISAFLCFFLIFSGVGLSVEKRETESLFNTISSIVVTGDPLFSTRSIAKAMGVKRGKKVPVKQLKVLKERIRRFYRKKGYLEVEIGQPELLSDDGEGAKLVVNINAGYLVRIEFKGAGVFASRKLRKITGMTHRSIFVESVMKEAERRIERYYRNRGYYFAQTRHEMETDAEQGIKIIRFDITKGKRQRVEKIDVEGNTSFSDQRIKKVMKTKEKGLLKRGILKENVLEGDPSRIEDFYSKKGYIEAGAAQSYLRFDDKRERATVGMEIKEGERFLFGKLVLSGLKALPVGKVEDMLDMERGEVLSIQKAEKGINEIREYYLNNGFLDVAISSNLVQSEEKNVVDLEISLKEGPRYIVGNITVKGIEKTRDSLVRRKLTLVPGTIYSQNEVQETVKNLRSLGIFSTIKVKPEKREGVAGIMDVVLEMEEAKSGAIEIGFGYGSEEDTKGHFKAEYRNLMGMARSIEGVVEASGLALEFELGYKDPVLLGLDLAGSAKARYGETDEEFFKVRKFENIYSIERSFLRVYDFELSYSLELTEFFDVKPQALIDEDDINRLAIIRPAITRDTRDNEVNAHKGMLTRLSFEFAPEFLGSEVEYYRAMAGNTTYLNLFGDVVLTVNMEASYGEVFGETLSLPLDKRFFLGGSDSVRGYDRNTIGPQDRLGEVVGGDASASYNVEFSFPIWRDIYGAVFTDGGNSWLLDPPPEIDNKPFRLSAGVGLHYSTPVGFLRLDFGYKLNRLRGEDTSQLHFRFGREF